MTTPTEKAIAALENVISEHENLEANAPTSDECGECTQNYLPHKRLCVYHAAKEALAALKQPSDTNPPASNESGAALHKTMRSAEWWAHDMPSGEYHLQSFTERVRFVNAIQQDALASVKP